VSFSGRPISKIMKANIFFSLPAILFALIPHPPVHAQPPSPHDRWGKNAFISKTTSNGRLFERCPMNCDPEYQCYDKFDIASYLKPGKNCITAIVQNFGVGLHSQINARGGFFFQAKLDNPGKSINLLSDSTWKVRHAAAWNTQTRYRDPGCMARRMGPPMGIHIACLVVGSNGITPAKDTGFGTYVLWMGDI
jgi:hypothetical protein